MTTPDADRVTQLLAAVGAGSGTAREDLWRAVYAELHRVAHRQMGAEHGTVGIQTTIPVHEAYLRLVGPEDDGISWANRRHFFAAAAEAMRRIRVDYARNRRSLKRGGGHVAAELSAEPAASDEADAIDILALDGALKKLEAEAPRTAEVLKLRYFAGLSVDETAASLHVAPRTVDLDWRFARTWLHRALSCE